MIPTTWLDVLFVLMADPLGLALLAGAALLIAVLVRMVWRAR